MSGSNKPVAEITAELVIHLTYSTNVRSSLALKVMKHFLSKQVDRSKKNKVKR